MNDIPLKRCSRCGQNLPITDFYKRCSQCKRCYSVSRGCVPREILPEGIKRCSKCRRELPSTREFFTSGRGKRGLHTWCRECFREYERERYRTSEDKERRQTKKKWQKPEAKERQRRWRLSPKGKESERQYRKSPRGKATGRAKTARRDARELALPALWNAEFEQSMMDYWEHRCCICGRSVGLWHTIAVDHWIPLSDPRPDNPGTVPTNMLPMCHARKGSNGQGDCNHSKGDKDPIAWLAEKFGPREAQKILARIEAYFEWARR